MRRTSVDYKKDLSGKIVLSTFFILTVYFLYHAISGERGLIALISLTKNIEESQLQLDYLRADRLNQEHRAASLRPESLDLDLLEEQARRYIGYVKAEEVVIAAEK